MNDSICIEGLLARCILGVAEDERREKQDVIIRIVLEGDFREAARTDDIERAVNYRTVTKRVLAFVEASSFRLVEALAERVAGVCLEDARVATVRVRVEKPGALRFVRTVAVEVVRGREAT